MPAPLLLASDLDGTLLPHDKVLTERTVDALHAANDAGIVVCAATGRSSHTAVPLLAPAAPAVRWAICSNGSTIYDIHADVVDSQFGMSDDDAEECVATLMAQFPDLGLSWETAAGFGFNERFQSLRPDLDEQAYQFAPAEGTAEFLKDTLKLLLFHPELLGDGLLDAIAPHLPATVTASSSGGDFVEITGDGITKAYALGVLCERLGIDPVATATFGDQLNDLAMIEWSGHGVAMAESHPRVLAAADVVTVSNVDDGVAVEIERLLSA